MLELPCHRGEYGPIEALGCRRETSYNHAKSLRKLGFARVKCPRWNCSYGCNSARIKDEGIDGDVGQARQRGQAGGSAAGGGPTVEQIPAHLERVLASPVFRTSRRCQDLLRYVVENAALGRTDRLKERTIGVEVFARPASYEPSEDAIVRVNANEVRKRLAKYYLDAGREGVWIELPPGSYVPEFHCGPPAGAAVAQAPGEPVHVHDAPAAPVRKPLWRRLPAVVAAAATAAACCWPAPYGCCGRGSLWKSSGLRCSAREAAADLRADRQRRSAFLPPSAGAAAAEPSVQPAGGGAAGRDRDPGLSRR